MTSTPDPFPAATEVAKIPATDPADQASEVESEQVPEPDHVADTGDPDGHPAEPELVDETDHTEEAADGTIESAPSLEVLTGDGEVASPDGEVAVDEPTAEAGDEGEPSSAAQEPDDDDDDGVSTVEPVGGPSSPSNRDELPTKEIGIVPPATRSEPGEPAATPETPETPEGTVDGKPATSTSTGSGTPSTPDPSEDVTAPAADETFDFKALSFAAITAAHKKAVESRTAEDETDAPAGQEADGAAATEQPPAAAEPEAPAPAEAASDGSVPEAGVPAAPELFASPATPTPAPAVPPSPFPAGEAPQQHRSGTATQVQPAVQPSVPSPFPAPGGAAHGFPAVHDYAPEATYAGWRLPTPADETARRRRFVLMGAAVVAVIAVVAVVAIIVNVIGRQQWEPIEALIAESREVHPLQLVLGSCVETVPGDGEVSEVLAVPCDAAHAAQVVGRTDFADAAVWPGRDEVDQRVAQVCGTKQLGPRARASSLTDSVRYVVWGPSEESWDDGDRVGLCLATTAEPTTQDLLQ